MNATEITKENIKTIRAIVANSRETLNISCNGFRRGFGHENKAMIHTRKGGVEINMEIACNVTEFGQPFKDAEYLKIFSFLSYSYTARTFLKSIKVGDKVEISFLAGNDSPLMSEAGLTENEVRGIIQRGNEILKYSLGHEVVRKNSTEAMIRPL